MTDVSDKAGPPFQVLHVGRGLAAGDLDNDGRMDALMASKNEPMTDFHNHTTGGGRFVTLRLEGTKSNRDAVGAKVRSSAAAGDASPGVSGAAASCRPATRGCTSASARPSASIPSRCAGRPARLISTRTSRSIPAISCARGALRSHPLWASRNHRWPRNANPPI